MITFFPKWRSLFLFCLFFAFISCKQQNNGRQEAIENSAVSDHLLYQWSDQVLISAHRGGKGLLNYPENCLETMQLLTTQKINMFEIDLRTSSDGQLVLMHDKSLERTTKGTDLVDKYTLDELESIALLDDYGNPTNFKIPSFHWVLNWAKNQEIILQLDLKAVDYDQLAGLIDRDSLSNKIILIAYDLKQALALHKRFPQFMLSVAMRNEKEYKDHISSGIPTEQMIAFTGTKLSDPKLYRKIRAKGIKTILGTLGNLDKRIASKGKATYIEYVNLGIDVLATDRPLAARNATMNVKPPSE